MSASPLSNLIILHFDEASSRLSGLALTAGLRLRFGHVIDPLPLGSGERTWYDYATLLARAADKYCLAAFGLPALLDRLRASGVKFSCCLPLPGSGTLADAEAAVARMSPEALATLIYSETKPIAAPSAAEPAVPGLAPERAQELDALGGTLTAARPLPRILAEAEALALAAGVPPPSAAEVEAYRKLALTRIRAGRAAAPGR